MTHKLPASLRVDDFNRWKVDDLKKYSKKREHNATYRVKRELVAVAFALYQHCCCECGRIRASRSCRLPDPTYELIKWCDLHATGSESSSGGMDARIAAMGVKS